MNPGSKCWPLILSVTRLCCPDQTVDFAVGGGGGAASFNTPEAKEVIQAETYRWLLEYQMRNPTVFWIVMIAPAVFSCILLIAMMKLMYVRNQDEVDGY